MVVPYSKTSYKVPFFEVLLSYLHLLHFLFWLIRKGNRDKAKMSISRKGQFRMKKLKYFLYLLRN